MRFQESHTLNKGMASVLKMYTDAKYFTDKYAKLGHGNVRVVSSEMNGDVYTIVAEYETKPTIKLPSFAEKFVSSTMQVTQTDTWNVKTGTGTLSVAIKGMPTKVTANMKLADKGDKSVLTLDYEVSVKIPLIGGKLESVIADDVKSKSPEDTRVSNELLAAY